MANMHRMHFMFYMHYMHVLYPHMQYMHGGIYKRANEKENGGSCYVRIQELNIKKILITSLVMDFVSQI